MLGSIVRKVSGENGVSLIIAVFSMMLLAVLGLTMAMMISGDFEMNARDLESEQAFYLAEAGLQEGISRVLGNTSLLDTDTKSLNRKLAGGEYNVTRATNGTLITLVSSGYVPSQQLRRALRQVKASVQSGFSLGSGGTVIYSNGEVSSSGNAHVNGNVTEDAPAGSLPAVIVPNPPLGSANSGALSISGNDSVTIASGNYKYSSISLSGNGKLTIYGPANIYLTGATSFGVSGNNFLYIMGGAVNIFFDGALSLGGNAQINPDQPPSQLVFLGTASNHSDITLSGNGIFHGVIYAPTVDLSVSGNGHYYGSYVGSDATLSGNAIVSYDPSVSSVVIPGVASGGSKVVSWQEQ